jgi:metal-dependent HD superfamily phosphatase/phosphodiesterase
MPLNIPTRHNSRLQALVERADADEELHALWKCANINAVNRSGVSDHGEVHIKIVTNMALKLIRLLHDANVQMSVVEDHKMTYEDAEVIVVLAALLHDLGISIHRDDHEQYSLFLANLKAKELLGGIYPIPERTVIVSEVLHAIIAHQWDARALTIEAGVLKVADALDMTKGRSRIPFEAGATNIHAVSAQAIDSVTLHKGDDVPIVIEIAMSNSAGIFQVDELLKRKLRGSTIAPYVRVLAKIEGETERKIVQMYQL